MRRQGVNSRTDGCSAALMKPKTHYYFQKNPHDPTSSQVNAMWNFTPYCLRYIYFHLSVGGSRCRFSSHFARVILNVSFPTKMEHVFLISQVLGPNILV